MTTTTPGDDWENEFYNGVALKIGKAGTSEGITNVKNEVRDFIRSLIRAEKLRVLEPAIKSLDGFVLAYLCPLCVERQNDITGECNCDCHDDNHIDLYRKQIEEDLTAITDKLKEEI